MAFDRGNTIFFRNIVFRDSSNAVVTATSADLKIKYRHCGCATTTSATLASSGGVWSGSWDSGQSDAGTVYGSIRGVVTTSSLEVVRDFSFQLKANAANEIESS
jgi:hypothetical protein